MVSNNKKNIKTKEKPGSKIQETKNLLNIIESIEQIKKQNNKKLKIIEKQGKIKEIKKSIEIHKEKKDNNSLKKLRKDYLSLINNIISQQSFYDSNKGFNYEDYMISPKIKTYSAPFLDFNTPSKEKKYYDSPLIESVDVDKMMDNFKFSEMKGQVLGDYLIPENTTIDEFERFNYFKKLNPAVIMLKYELKLK